MYVSILVTISREDRVDFVINQLDRVVFPGRTLELVIALDNKKISRFDVLDKVDASPIRSLLKNVECFNTGNVPPSKFAMHKRRSRIAALHNKAKEFIGGSDFLFCFEDDTILPYDPIGHLVDQWRELSEDNFIVGYIEGVQVGRWGRQYIGAWNSNQEFTEFTSLPFSKDGIEPISGGGFYCFLTMTSLYKETDISWSEPVGPDVWYGVNLAKKGYTSFIDWELVCGHDTKSGKLYPGPQAVSVTMALENGRVIMKRNK